MVVGSEAFKESSLYMSCQRLASQTRSWSALQRGATASAQDSKPLMATCSIPRACCILPCSLCTNCVCFIVADV